MSNIKVIGPFNSGTNLMDKIVSSFNRFNCKGFFKHTLNLKKIEVYLNKNKNNKIVCMYRNIFSWLNSMEKVSYSIKYNNIYDNDLLIDPVKKFRKPEYMKTEYSNIFEFYWKYYENYMNLKEKYGEQVIIINYYNLINDSEKYIFEKFNGYELSADKIKKILNKPSKKHGKPVKNINEAVEKYNMVIKSWNEKDRAYIQKHIDEKMYNYFESIY